MYQSDTELLFPPRVISALRDHRGENWQTLIDCVSQQESADLDRVAFVLLMVRLGGCDTCHADSFRAMRGCTQCAIQTVRRFRGNDDDLLRLFTEARIDVEQYMKEKSR